MKKRGFTLIELLVVIAIIAILAAMIFPVFSRARAAARKAVCQSKLKQIVLAIQLYAEDYNERLYGVRCYNVPGGYGLRYWSGHGWTEAISPYLGFSTGVAGGDTWSSQFWKCPSAQEYPDPPGLPGFGAAVFLWPHYAFNAYLRWNQGYDIGRARRPDKVLLVADSYDWNMGPFCTGYMVAQTPDTTWDGQANDTKAGRAPYNVDVSGPIVPIAWANSLGLPEHQNDDYTRHGGGSNIGFLDGHVKYQPAAKITYNRLMGDGYPGYDPNLP